MIMRLCRELNTSGHHECATRHQSADICPRHLGQFWTKAFNKKLTKNFSTQVLTDITFILYLASYLTKNNTQPRPDDRSGLRLEHDAQLKTHDCTHPTSSLDDTPTRMTMSGLMMVAQCANACIIHHKTEACHDLHNASVLPLNRLYLEHKATLCNQTTRPPNGLVADSSLCKPWWQWVKIEPFKNRLIQQH